MNAKWLEKIAEYLNRKESFESSKILREVFEFDFPTARHENRCKNKIYK
jgi:hypothetical protein